MRTRESQQAWPKWLASLLFVSLPAFSADPFPMPHNADTVYEIEKNIDSWRGKLLAFPGRVTRIEDGYEGRPLLRVMLHSPHADSRHLWVASQVKPESEQFRLGDVVMVLGKVDLAGDDDPVTTPVYDTTYHVAGICLVNATKYEIYSSTGATSRCDAWRAGATPEDLAHM